jgi:hypothetical protein
VLGRTRGDPLSALQRVALALAIHDGSVGRVHFISIVAALDGDKDIEPLRDDEAEQDQRGDEVGVCEAEDVGGILGAVGGECWKRKTVDDGQEGPVDVAEQNPPEEGDFPVLAGADDDVEVAAELLALWKDLC